MTTSRRKSTSSTAQAHEAGSQGSRSPGPLYAKLKQYVSEKIAAGVWPEGHRVPSENALVREFGVARMTVNRALRELAAEGLLTRVQGVGTFVAEQKPLSALLEIRNIADEIRARGHRHRAEVHLLAAEAAPAPLAAELELPAGAEIFHSVLVHFENDVPVQLEERYVNPAAAPGYVDQDFTRMTPNEYLMQVAPLDEVEHIIEAVMPDAPTRRLLRMKAHEPCLLLRRRTWSGGAIAARSRFLHPGTRYRLGGTFAYMRPEAPGAGALQPRRYSLEEIP